MMKTLSYNWFKQILRLYARENELRNNQHYKIIDATNKDSIKFQLTGKNIGFEMSAQALMRSDMLMDFGKADIAIITHLGTKKELDEAKPGIFARIVRQLFGINGKAKFLLAMPEQQELVEAQPEEMLSNREALNMLSSEDAARIGFAAAENRYFDLKKILFTKPTHKVLYHDLINHEIHFLDEESNTEHRLAVEALFYEKNLLAKFSKHEQQMIGFIAGEIHQQKNKSQTQAKLRLLAYQGSIVEYEDLDGENYSMNFLEIATDLDLLSQFSQSDRDIIRFAAGELSKEKELALKRT